MPPVMLGPMLLHWDGNMDSYHKFGQYRPSWPILTRRILYSGQMRSLLQLRQLAYRFPMHLKDNAIVNLGKSLPQTEVTKIISKLFGESGILASEDQVTFDKIRDELTHSYDIPYLS